MKKTTTRKAVTAEVPQAEHSELVWTAMDGLAHASEMAARSFLRCHRAIAEKKSVRKPILKVTLSSSWSDDAGRGRRGYSSGPDNNDDDDDDDQVVPFNGSTTLYLYRSDLPQCAERVVNLLRPFVGDEMIDRLVQALHAPRDT